MARKKLTPIVSLGKNEDKLLVQKSKPLFALWQSKLSLAEFKILDIYLSRIDSHNPEQRTVIFEKGELEKILGVKRIRIEELDKRLENLGKMIKFEDSNNKKKLVRIALFEKAVAEQDDDDLWKIELTCTQSAMKYFFNVDNLGYLKYRLKLITSITSRYTYILFLYLEMNKYRKSWKVDLEELKQILNCDKEETYKEYKRFNDLLLKKVQKEMHEKTECRFAYKPVKKGRSVVAIEFTLETIPKVMIEEIEPNPITAEEDNIEIINKYTAMELWQQALCINYVCEFDETQLEEIWQILITIPNHKLPEALYGGIEVQRYHYLAQKFAALNRADSKEKPIKNRFLYFIKMLKADIKD